MAVVVSHLTKTYGTQHAVNDISFEVKQGGILGLLGPNGAGKSTTMKIATCYIPPTQGSVHIAGFDVNTHPLEVRKRVGYLPEHNPLYLDMYVHEYLQFIGSLHGLKGQTLKQRVNEMVEMTGLTREQAKKIGVLSKGYRQRVGLAQAMIHNPEVLILDEPTTGLDPNQILEIRSLIKNLGKEKTVILSTHIMQEVQAVCDRVVIINAGKLVADDSIEALKKLGAGAKKLITEFQSPINVSQLQSLSGVIQVTALPDNKYEIITDASDLRAALFNLSTEQGWTLLGMTQEERSLENIFRELTQ